MKDMTFEDLSHMTRDMSDQEQRDFMIKASLAKFSPAFALPSRMENPSQAAMDQQIFEEEQGFVGSSKEFKDMLRGGMGRGMRKVGTSKSGDDIRARVAAMKRTVRKKGNGAVSV
ncbi:unnamed protein product [Discosporangium mesarthrocarpum]